MITLYTIAMFAFVYLSYGAGAIQRDAVLVTLYIIGAFAMGLLALAASSERNKRKAALDLNKAWERFISNPTVIERGTKQLEQDMKTFKKEERENEATTNR